MNVSFDFSQIEFLRPAWNQGKSIFRISGAMERQAESVVRRHESIVSEDVIDSRTVGSAVIDLEVHTAKA